MLEKFNTLIENNFLINQNKKFRIDVYSRRLWESGTSMSREEKNNSYTKKETIYLARLLGRKRGAKSKIDQDGACERKDATNLTVAWCFEAHV